MRSDCGKVHVLNRMAQEGMRVNHTIQAVMQFKTYKLFVSRTFFFGIFSCFTVSN